jgi:hypothetical protein
VTFTQNEEFFNIHFVVWQFWGRAAEASWTEKSKALFYCLATPREGLGSLATSPVELAFGPKIG